MTADLTPEARLAEIRAWAATFPRDPAAEPLVYMPDMLDALALLDAARAETEHWKANHDRQVAIKRDLHKRYSDSRARIAALEAALSAGVATHGEPCLAGDDCEFIQAARTALAGTGR